MLCAYLISLLESLRRTLQRIIKGLPEGIDDWMLQLLLFSFLHQNHALFRIYQFTNNG